MASIDMKNKFLFNICLDAVFKTYEFRLVSRCAFLVPVI